MADNRTSTYLQYLPAALQAQRVANANGSGDPSVTPDPFLGRFLLAFERILSGWAGTEHGSKEQTPRGLLLVRPGLEQLLSSIPRFFVPVASDPTQAVPLDFLPWLAGWVSVSLRGEWNEDQQRSFLQQAPSLYRQRGTLACMRKMLDIYLPGASDVEEVDSPPHYFTVTFRAPSNVAADVQLYDRAIRAIVDQEKPAHTYYGLYIICQPMTVPFTIGVDSTLGAPYSPSSSSSSSSGSG